MVVVIKDSNECPFRSPGHADGDSSCSALEKSKRRSLSCGTELAAVCVLANTLVFPRLTDFVRITPELDGVSFEKFPTSDGWKVNYSVDMWPSNSLHRK